MNHAKHSHAQRIVALLGMTAILCQQASADVVQWTVAAGSWYNPNNWVPMVIPSGDDEIYIGNLPGVQNGVVWMGGAETASYDHLEVSSGMTLDLNGTELISLIGHAWITGLNTRLIVRPAPLGINPHDFQGVLHLGFLAEMQLEDDVEIRIFNGSESAGRIFGRGHILVSANVPFINNGIIDPANNGGITMTHGQPFADQAVDLDGTNGFGQLVLDDAFSTLEINASNLTDAFSSTISLTTGAVLTMNITDGWTADANSQINIAGTDNPGAASLIDGEEFTFGGTMSVSNHEAHLRVLAPTILTETAEIGLNVEGWVVWDGETTVNGGVYTLNQDAYMDFYGPTEMKGGVFNTFSNSLGDGSVNFHNETTWNGNVAINGVARQDGDADVTGSTIIDAGVFDMDGIAGGTAWGIIGNFVLNAESIDSTPGDRFNGTINVAGGFLPKLVVNLSNSDANWGMDGTMNLSGVSQLFETRLSGSPVDVEGDVSIDGNVSITANVTFSDTAGGATLNLGTDGAALRMTGETVVRQGVQILGDGTLQNGPTGMMILDDGVSLGNVALANLGLLKLAEGPGSVSMDYFENGSSGTWVVELGGYVPGIEHDELIISGSGGLLDGILEIELLDVGGEPFMPQIGDEFTILTMPDGIDGAFANAPVTITGSKTYEWSVQYSRSNVLVRLDNITTEPVPVFAPIPPGVVDGVDHDIRKQRFLSINPNNPGARTRMRLSLLDNGCSVTGKQCSGNASCKACDGGSSNAGDSCDKDSQCAGGLCVVSGETCEELSAPVVLGFVLDPVQGGGDSPPNTLIAGVGADPGFRVWDETLVHITDCEVAPGRVYRVDVESVDSPGLFLNMDMRTSPTPEGKDWGDIVGNFNGVDWTPGNYLVNVDDVNSIIKFLTLKPAPHVTRCEMLSANAPLYVNMDVNASELGQILACFNGDVYPPIPMVVGGYPDLHGAGTLLDCTGN